MTNIPKSTSAPQMHIPARRSAGVLRICLMTPLGAGLLWIVLTGFSKLDFQRPDLNSRLVDSCWAFLFLLLGAVGTVFVLIGLRWLAFSLWPAPMGLSVEQDQLRLNLGPFGRHDLDLGRLSASYRFEIREKGELAADDDFLNPDDEERTQLPLLHHPDHPVPLNYVLDKYIGGSNEERLASLRPLIEFVRMQ